MAPVLFFAPFLCCVIDQKCQRKELYSEVDPVPCHKSSGPYLPVLFFAPFLCCVIDQKCQRKELYFEVDPVPCHKSRTPTYGLCLGRYHHHINRRRLGLPAMSDNRASIWYGTYHTFSRKSWWLKVSFSWILLDWPFHGSPLSSLVYVFPYSVDATQFFHNFVRAFS